jgi:hypothetical protein
MRTYLLIAGAALIAASVASAQDVPRVEVFGGYSYGSIRAYVADESLYVPGTGPDTFPRFGSNGWTGSVAVNATSWFAVVADVSSLYATPTRTIGVTPVTVDMHEHNYLFGPRFSAHYGPCTIFAHGLFGEAHASVLVKVPEATPIDIVDTRLAMLVGAGVDLTVYRRHGQSKGARRELALRLGEVDWLRTNFIGNRQNNVRLSAGLVFRF